MSVSEPVYQIIMRCQRRELEYAEMQGSLRLIVIIGALLFFAMAPFAPRLLGNMEFYAKADVYAAAPLLPGPTESLAQLVNRCRRPFPVSVGCAVFLRTRNFVARQSSAHGSDTAEPDCQIDRLPDELLVAVLSQVFPDQKTLIQSVPAVCQRWRRLCATRNVLPWLDLTSKAPRRNFAKERRAIIARGDSCDPARGKRYRFPRLVRLWLTILRFPKVRRIVAVEANDLELELVSAGFPELTTVVLVGGCSISWAGLAILAKGCPRLTRLDLSGSTLLYYPSRLKPARIAKQIGLPRFENLTNLNLSTHSHMTLLANECPKLAKLELRGCSYINEHDFAALAGRSPPLVQLILVDCQRLPNKGVEAVVASCADTLRSVDLTGSSGLMGHPITQTQIDLARRYPSIEFIDAGSTKEENLA